MNGIGPPRKCNYNRDTMIGAGFAIRLLRHFRIYFLPNGLRMCIIKPANTHRRWLLRTNVVIDDDLMKSAIKVSGKNTKKAAIEEGLKLLVKVKGQEKIRGLRGKLRWIGDLDEMRSD
jgi:Arc/MetJ family transcription regulator